MREHNRIARELKLIHRKWTDENIYQEARRINTAQYQHIAYSEWLPIVIGAEKMKAFNLEVNKGNTNDFFNEYNSSINPHMAAEVRIEACNFFLA